MDQTSNNAVCMGDAHRIPEILDDLPSGWNRRPVEALAAYIDGCLGQPPRISPATAEGVRTAPLFVLGSPETCRRWNLAPPPDGSESYALDVLTNQSLPSVVLGAHSERGLMRAVQHAIRLLRQEGRALWIEPASARERPWIPEREWTVCVWEPQWVRAQFSNPWADARMNVFRFSRRQWRRYLALVDEFGFTGIQLASQCYNWHLFGSIETFHDKLGEIADLAHERGLSVSLWVWAAQFDGYGWLDPDIVYVPASGGRASEDPRVRRTFEKYYDHYSALAPRVDRIIGHFFDPGMLKRLDDALTFMRLLEEKCRARNPRLRFAIDAWCTGPEYAQTIRDAGLRDYLVLETSHWDDPRRREFRRQMKEAGFASGIWGWYDTEMESDQKASMFVNARGLQELYRNIRAAGEDIQPVVYWSEMEACHLINLFSVFVAGRLLWNPDRDPMALLRECVEGIWGPRRSAVVLEALELIQDMRSGPTWATYWVERRLGTDDPDRDAARTADCIRALHALEPDTSHHSKFTLPVEPRVLIELMLPHLEQIRLYALFRRRLAEAKDAAAAGADKGRLTELIEAAWQPIPDFTTWIGTCGALEAQRQEKEVRAFCTAQGLPMPRRPWRRALWTARLLEKMADAQCHHARPVPCSIGFLCDDELNLSRDETLDLMTALARDGVVKSEGPDAYVLTNWQDFPDVRHYGLGRLTQTE